MEKATAGASTKIHGVDYEKIAMDFADDSVSKNNIEVDVFLHKMAKHFVRFDMMYLYQKFPLLEEPANNPSDHFRSGKVINMFEKRDQIGPSKEVTLGKIADFISWLQTYLDSRSEAYIKDLKWTLAYLLNSMHPKLEQSVNTTMSFEYSSDQHGGPLIFAIMIDK
eukprot:1948121-Ditylum_brightwellii.AAC.1